MRRESCWSWHVTCVTTWQLLDVLRFSMVKRWTQDQSPNLSIQSGGPIFPGLTRFIQAGQLRLRARQLTS